VRRREAPSNPCESVGQGWVGAKPGRRDGPWARAGRAPWPGSEGSDPPAAREVDARPGSRRFVFDHFGVDGLEFCVDGLHDIGLDALYITLFTAAPSFSVFAAISVASMSITILSGRAPGSHVRLPSGAHRLEQRLLAGDLVD
jgi:hypothetical protein